jgi:hypothetical protein
MTTSTAQKPCHPKIEHILVRKMILSRVVPYNLLLAPFFLSAGTMAFTMIPEGGRLQPALQRLHSAVNPSSDHSHTAGSVDLEGLERLGYTKGLCEALISSDQMVAKRFWILDNSGSMAVADACRLVESSSGAETLESVPCTRWRELQDTVNHHIQLSARLRAPTVFRMLNSPGLFQGNGRFSIAEGPSNNANNNIEKEIQTAMKTIRDIEPFGATPISRRLKEVQKEIEQLELTDGRRAVVIIATDGLPTDDNGEVGVKANTELEQTLESLSNRLPVSVIIRLCTGDERVVDYYNSLDAKLELNLDILDDYFSEAKEVQRHNKWLNYAPVLHRMRERGANRRRWFDLMDERKLTKDELWEYSTTVYGDEMAEGIPDPQSDWKTFCNTIEWLNSVETGPWNPITGKTGPWIDTAKY